jgi:Lon protease-like protein
MAAPHVIAPIFPLPDVTFFPHTLLPLHVFEARYRAMVVDALERDRRLIVVRLQPGYEATYAGKPPVYAVGGLGEIVSCERLANGRYNVLLRGESRVRIEGELPSDTLYRLVRARRLTDGEATGDAGPALTRIRASCQELLGALARPPDLLDTALAEGQAPGVIADRVTAAVLPDVDLRQQLLELLDVDTRMARVADALEALVRELKGGRE